MRQGRVSHFFAQYNFEIHLIKKLFLLTLMNDKSKKVFKLIGTFLVINIITIVSGFLYQKIAKSSYHNQETNHYDQFRSSIGYCVVLKFITWLLAELNCKRAVKKQEYVVIDKKKSFVCGLIITLSTVSFMEALYLISYPFIMMAKSASVLQVVLIGVFCAPVKDQNGNLGRQKVFNAFIVTLGVLLFKIFDPQTSFHSQLSRQTELLGFLLLMVNIIVDCFYPHFQTQIQINSNPKPAQMLAELSKWSFIISFILSIIHGDLIYTINFMYKHPIFIIQILSLAMLSFLGQTLVYNIIQNFESKFAPLINSTRKTFTVAFNLIIFGHRTSFSQITGILICFSVTMWQFLEKFNKNSEKEMAKQQIKLNQIYEIEPQFGPFRIGNEQAEKNEEYQKIESKNLGFFAEEEEQSTFPTS